MPTCTAVIEVARSWLGTPYVHQASVKKVGADCLGLIRGVYRELYGCEPEQAPVYAADWAEVGGQETLRDAARRHLKEIDASLAQQGDVLLFRIRRDSPAKHAGILVDPLRMIHAYSGRAVCESHLSLWWERRLAYAFRFPGVTD